MRAHDVIIIGSGSGNSLLGPDYEGLDVAIIDGGTFGGTCLNVGCIPTKMYVYPAEVVQSARELGPLGVSLDADAAEVDWPAIRDRIFGRIDAISEGGLDYRRSLPDVTVYQEHVRFTGPKTLVTDSGQELTAPKIVIASGSRVELPDLPGVDLPQVHTSDTVMRLPERPARVVIVGGGYIAAEFAHIFHGLGAHVTQLNRSERLLRGQDREIAERFREAAENQWDLHLGWTPEAILPEADGTVTVRSTRTSQDDGAPGDTGPGGSGSSAGQGDTREDVADVVLMATGRRPNTDLLDPAAAGLGVDQDSGLLRVDEYQRVLDTDGNVVEGLWALGDICSPAQLKHVANHEARVVAHNVVHPEDPVAADHRFIPAAVFTHPEIASVGLTEDQAREEHGRVAVKSQAFGDVAYGWAMEDRTGICKVIADPATGQLLGAHLIGAHASILIQPLIQAMSTGQTVQEIARGQYWIHPSLTEVVENALLGLELD
ncbi:mycothione reductase [Kocuria sp. JC486]|uniref:mycothione reductase n=1 Tax=Kocuria sp. JC486 TaxID=1970736 RepID=UPI0014227FFF|nr:mycothione reductase [Kocuria sp. JC486]NHU84432.1 mycothione reductase [Kocuria sp. JC486]